jgi:hypothetical protein
MMNAETLTRLAEFTLIPFAALRAVRSGRANGLATLSLGERAAIVKRNRDVHHSPSIPHLFSAKGQH